MTRKETIAAIQRRLQNLQENKPEGCEATKAAFKQAIDDINALLELNSENALEILEQEIEEGHTVKLEKYSGMACIRIWHTETGEQIRYAGSVSGLRSALQILTTGSKDEKSN